MDPKQSRISVLMMPWLAHGHISPYLELAKKLAKRNFHIYLCSTPINLNFVQKRIAGDQSLSIELIELHLESSPELPPHFHTTNGLPLHLHSTLKKALQKASPAFSNILKRLSPDLVLFDFYLTWAPVIASSYNIPAVEFMTWGTLLFCFGHHLANNPEVEFPFPEISISGYIGTQFRKMVEHVASEYKEGDADNAKNAMALACNIILTHTFKELEGNYIDYLSSLRQKKIVPVGPLIQETSGDTKENAEIIQWLDRKDKSSSVFVSFGSEYFPSKEDTEELAYGLELSAVDFIWVIRFPKGEETNVEEVLPEGYVEKVGERGLVVKNWAPQARILAHPSIVGFVSHCGWNSTVESLNFGVPIVAMPMHLDQPINAKLVESLGVSVVVERDEKGKLNREILAQVIRLVVVDKEGESLRNKAREFSETMRSKGDEEIDEVVKELVKIVKDGKKLASPC